MTQLLPLPPGQRKFVSLQARYWEHVKSQLSLRQLSEPEMQAEEPSHMNLETGLNRVVNTTELQAGFGPRQSEVYFAGSGS